MKTTFLTLLFHLLSSTVCFGALDSREDVDALTSDFMKLVAVEKYTEAFQLLEPHWPLSKADFESLIGKTSDQMGTVKREFGAVTGIELVRTETAGDALLRHSILQKFEKHGLRWLGTYYKPGGTWMVNSVVWDDSIEKLLEPANE